MTSKWREPNIIADASPLIGLAKIERLELLHQLADEVWIPSAVWREVALISPGRPEVRALTAALVHCVREPSVDAFTIFRLQSDEGEAAALALASSRPGALLLMDDQEGRRIAARYGFRYLGTLGLLLRAKRAGLVGALKTEIQALHRNGLYLDQRVIRQVMDAAGEV